MTEQPVTRTEFNALSARVDKLDGGVIVTPPVTSVGSVVVTPGVNSVHVEWIAPTGKTQANASSSRNGVDNTGAGPWTNNFTTQTHDDFDKLLAGTSYTFTVLVTYTDGTSESLTGTGTPTAPVTGTGTGGAILAGVGGWESGVWGRNDASTVTKFASDRGAPVKNIGVFPDRNTGWAGLANNWWTVSIPAGAIAAGAHLSVALPLWPESGSSGLGSATDQQWRDIANSIKAVDPTAHIRLGWEMNLGNNWHISAGNRSAWIAEWRRAATLMKSVAPGFRFCWNPNSGGDQTGTSSRSAFQAVKDLCYSYGIDSYDAWPGCNTTTGLNVHKTGVGFLGESYAYAKANGVKFALPEWAPTNGSAWAGSQGGDDPTYVKYYMEFMRGHATDMAFDCYFFEPQGYLRSDIFTGNMPNASAEYRNQCTNAVGVQ